MTPSKRSNAKDASVSACLFTHRASFVSLCCIASQRYMAPEQFRGEAGPTSDLYALGGTVLYLLSGGRHPSDFQAAR